MPFPDASWLQKTSPGNAIFPLVQMAHVNKWTGTWTTHSETWRPAATCVRWSSANMARRDTGAALRASARHKVTGSVRRCCPWPSRAAASGREHRNGATSRPKRCVGASTSSALVVYVLPLALSRFARLRGLREILRLFARETGLPTHHDRFACFTFFNKATRLTAQFRGPRQFRVCHECDFALSCEKSIES
jgi:hypothetical protein